MTTLDEIDSVFNCFRWGPVARLGQDKAKKSSNACYTAVNDKRQVFVNNRTLHWELVAIVAR
ncbi:MAG: hypothetical protein CUN54_10585 [Phototrophicales bacterium]|nr:MAG: hypothetical protein CUN54_10585 [Phototrophicales bacterium]